MYYRLFRGKKQTKLFWLLDLNYMPLLKTYLWTLERNLDVDTQFKALEQYTE